MAGSDFVVKKGLVVKENINVTGNVIITGTITSTGSPVPSNNQLESAYSQANTATILAQAAFNTANNSTDSWVRTAANSASSYANSAFEQANTVAGVAVYAQTTAQNSYIHANSAYNKANTASINATSAGSYANSAYTQANTATVNASTADQKAVSAGSYANSAYAKANTAITSLSGYATESYVGTQISNLVNSAPSTLDTLNELATALGNDASFSTSISNMVGVSGGYANSAYSQANTATIDAATADQKAVSAGSYANSSYTKANTAIIDAASSGSYANSSYTKANTGTILAQAAFDSANTKISSVPNSNTQVSSLGVGTASSGTTGEIRATNNITAYYSSDKSLKENVIDIPNALDAVNHIGGKLFDWTDSYIESKGGADGYFVSKQDFGVIAQDVQEVFPRAVRTREDGTLAVDYEKLCALAFAAIKELSEKINDLEG